MASLRLLKPLKYKKTSFALFGRKFASRTASGMRRHGIVRRAQSVRLADKLTVLEALILARFDSQWIVVPEGMKSRCARNVLVRRKLADVFALAHRCGDTWRTRFDGDALPATHKDKLGCSIDGLPALRSGELVVMPIVGDVTEAVDGCGSAERARARSPLGLTSQSLSVFSRPVWNSGLRQPRRRSSTVRYVCSTHHDTSTPICRSKL